MSFTVAAVVAGAGLIAAGVGGGIGASQAKKQREEAEAREDEAREEMLRQKEIYAQLDTSNPYANMENMMEDLTINQQQAEFQKQQSMQSQANILNELKGAAGGSGVAGLAQAMANQGQLAAQQASASIGEQEAANQRLAAQQAQANQNMLLQGEVMSRNWQRDQEATLLGMAQGEVAGHRATAQQAAAAQQAALAGITAAGTSAIGTAASLTN
tara:strand:- start:439 stop:1080 length:642 start_codon:yes stop_codon:yes gene_type:complete